MKLVQSWVVAVAGELDLELQFILLHRQLAHRAGGADARPAPGAIRPSGWEFSIANYCSGFLAEDCFVRHLGLSEGPAPQRDLRGAPCLHYRVRQPQSPVEGRVTIAQTLGKVEQGGSGERVVTYRNRVGREWRNWQTRWT